MTKRKDKVPNTNTTSSRPVKRHCQIHNDENINCENPVVSNKNNQPPATTRARVLSDIKNVASSSNTPSPSSTLPTTHSKPVVSPYDISRFQTVSGRTSTPYDTSLSQTVNGITSTPPSGVSTFDKSRFSFDTMRPFSTILSDRSTSRNVRTKKPPSVGSNRTPDLSGKQVNLARILAREFADCLTNSKDKDCRNSKTSSHTTKKQPKSGSINSIPTTDEINRMLFGEDSDRENEGSDHSDFEFYHSDVDEEGNEQVIDCSSVEDSESEGDDLEDDSEQNNNFEEYLDDGDPEYECHHCGAIFWYNERLNKRRNAKRPEFSLCCSKGDVRLPFLKASPEVLLRLVTEDSKLGRHFREFIRIYNMVFSMTSLGGRVDRSVKKGRGPSMFRLQGENYHRMGSLKPGRTDFAKFSQMYIVDTENEVENRRVAPSKGKNYQPSDPPTKKGLKDSLIETLIKLLDDVNPYVQVLRTARDRIDVSEEEKLQLRIICARGKDPRTYNTHATSEVAALIVDDFREGMDKRDIVIEKRSNGKLKRISEIHPCYLALQYPLLFPYGEDGFQVGIKKGMALSSTKRKKKTDRGISMRQFFAFRFQERKRENQHILLRSRRLLQQILCDSFTTVESNRMSYIRQNQTNLRATNAESIKKASETGTSLAEEGNKVLLPSSFSYGPRYMQQHYLDAMAVCKHFGFPDLFITFTCNPKWPELTRHLSKIKLTAEDRPDLIARVFKMKLNSLMDDLTKNSILGKTISAMYTIEFQKIGLPHAHILLFMDQKCKFPSPRDIDRIISAEIPDPVKDKSLYEVVKNNMMHGPCGAANYNAPCMVNGKCSKFFPKANTDLTTVGKDGYPIYRRRITDRYVEKYGVKMDNRWVVPYNRALSLRYRAHINVEWCNQAGSIKYLFKYIHKGPDMATVTVEPVKKKKDKKNEVQDFFDCRYVSSCEAAWRIYAFPMCYRSTPVEKLQFHLPGEQSIVYKENESADSVIDRISTQGSQLLSWFKVNDHEEDNIKVLANDCTYKQIPNKFTWNKKNKIYKERQRGFSVGRINYVPRKIQEKYHLRMLLNSAKGVKSFDDLKFHNDVLYATFKEACWAKGLLEDDKEYIESIVEVAFWANGHFTRKLFVLMLLSDSLTSPEKVWESTWKYLCDDIERLQRDKENQPELTLTDADKQNLCLIEIENQLASNGSSLSNFESMPQPNLEGIEKYNRFIREEREYNTDDLNAFLANWVGRLTDEQRIIYDEIVGAVFNNTGGVYFVYGFGGTRKTKLWEILSAAIRSKGLIVLNVASSGIASLLLVGGRTAHSRFGIPINVNEISLCNMKRGSELAELVKEASMIIWDEAPMMSRYCFESLDRSMRDIIIDASDKPFGGKVVVFGGDFRQILPVITGGSRQDIVRASLCSSYLWKNCTVLTLTKNMRLLANLSPDEAQNIKEFSEWLLDVGDGKITDNDGEADIEIPDEFLIKEATKPVEAIVASIYGERLDKPKNPDFFQKRAILCPTNDDVNQINEYLISQLKGEEKTYLSADSIDPADKSSLDNPVYSPDFLNSIKLSGLPIHSLRLKVGCPVMLLRNICPKDGLCNGTRLQITALYERTIEATVITGTKVGDKVHIPRMTITPSDPKLPFKMRRRQFPVTVAFAMTINKSQGQTLYNVWFFLPRPVFSHGQLYVALSRVTSKAALKVLILDNDGKPQQKTKNVVFKEIFHRVKKSENCFPMDEEEH